LIVVPSVACYLYYSQYLLPQNKKVVKKIIAVGTLLTEHASYKDCYWVTMFKYILTPFSVDLCRW